MNEEDNNGKEALIYAGAATVLTGIGIYGYNVCRKDDNTTATVAQEDQSFVETAIEGAGIGIGLVGTFALYTLLAYCALTATSDNRRIKNSRLENTAEKGLD